MHFLIVGLSHKTAPVEIRERLSIAESKVAGTLRRLLDQEDILEGMILSTCNRVEICLVSRHLERGEAVALRILAEEAGFSEGEIAPYLYTRLEGDAVGHLFRVTAGLDSMVVGEPQIGGQVKEAYTQAVAAQATGATLNKLIHRAIHVSKKIRTETGIGRNPVSVSYAAVLLAEKIFGRLAKKAVLVLGAGEMSERTLQYLKDRGVASVSVANRSLPKAEGLAGRIGGRAIGLEKIPEALETVDIVLSSVESPQPLIREADVRAAIAKRKGRSMFFIDIGVPRNIDPAVNQVENAYLYNIDDLQGIVEGNRKEREKEAVRAESIIGEEVSRFLREMKEWELKPTIQQLSKKFDRIRQRELERFFKNGAVSPGVKEEIEACTRAIVNKILHDPIILMKTEPFQQGGTAEILKKLFRLEKE